MAGALSPHSRDTHGAFLRNSLWNAVCVHKKPKSKQKIPIMKKSTFTYELPCLGSPVNVETRTWYGVVVAATLLLVW